ncbi:hypothetical protein AB0H07_39120 [Streptomyces sp. NPDC021354]|uniref:hypothetical protein n=1 Tax=Streptomyces sp. NPDC021354 TaxID=3154793 RepID=UPI0033D474D3
MSLTDFRTARRQDQESTRAQDREDRRLDAELDRVAKEQAREAEAARREQDRKDEAARREQNRLDAERNAREEQERKEAARAAKAQAAKESRRERARRRKERRERIAAWANRVPKWLAEHLDLAAALAVMGCSIVPALISQASSLRDTGLVTALGWLGWALIILLPVMLECSAWAATAGEAKALKAGRSPWPYRIAIYLFAGLAAWVNYLHGRNVGGERYGTLLGAVLAASSIVPIAVWQLVQLGRHREYRDRLKAARRTARQARKTRRIRKRKLPAIWATAVRLRAIAGYERLSEEDAWLIAYGVYEGAVTEVLSEDVLGLLSAEMLGSLVDAEGRRSVVLEELTAVRLERQKLSEKASEKGSEESVDESATRSATLPTRVFEASSTELVIRPGNHLLRTVSPQINPSVPPPAHTSENAPARTRDTTRTRTRKAPAKGTVRKLSAGARKAAAETAKTASADENAAIEDWVRGELRAGRTVNRKSVEDETVRRRKEIHGQKKAAKLGTPSKTWCYERIARARKPRPVSEQRSA